VDAPDAGPAPPEPCPPGALCAAPKPAPCVDVARFRAALAEAHCETSRVDAELAGDRCGAEQLDRCAADDRCWFPLQWQLLETCDAHVAPAWHGVPGLPVLPASTAKPFRWTSLDAPANIDGISVCAAADVGESFGLWCDFHGDVCVAMCAP
jgi:hypothetical protein